jgi:hypothetical protein
MSWRDVPSFFDRVLCKLQLSILQLVKNYRSSAEKIRRNKGGVSLFSLAGRAGRQDRGFLHSPQIDTNLFRCHGCWQSGSYPRALCGGHLNV